MVNEFETYRKRLDVVRSDCPEIEQALKMGGLIRRRHSCAGCTHFRIMHEVGFCYLWNVNLSSLDACATCPKFESISPEQRYPGGS